MKKCNHKHHWIGCVAMIILIIGGLNWGLIGLFDLNLVARLIPWIIIQRLIYVLVGLSAVYWIFCSLHCCRKHSGHGHCDSGSPTNPSNPSSM